MTTGVLGHQNPVANTGFLSPGGGGDTNSKRDTNILFGKELEYFAWKWKWRIHKWYY